jgi:hypothetical protein
LHCPLQAADNSRPIDQGTGRIMHQNQGELSRQCGKTRKDGILAGSAAYGETQFLGLLPLQVLMQQIDGRLVVIEWSDHHHAADRLHCKEDPAGADKDRRSGQQQELFGLLMAEAGTDPPGWNNHSGRGEVGSRV